MHETTDHVDRHSLVLRWTCSSKETVEAVTNNASELDALLTRNAVPVRLRVSCDVVRLNLDNSIQTKETPENVIHEIGSLLVLS